MKKIKKISMVTLTMLLLSVILAACGSPQSTQPESDQTASPQQESEMSIQQIRNATITVEYGGQKFLVDPMFAEKGEMEAFSPAKRSDRNPMVELPLSTEEILEGVDAVIITHTNEDHFDQAAKEMLPKDMKMFMQDEVDAQLAKDLGFTNIEVMEEGVDTNFNGVELTEVDGRHGHGEMAKIAGNVMGLVFQSPDEKTVYLAGDTVWYEKVQENIDTYKPEVIVLAGGDNQFLEGGSLIMGKEDIYEVFKAAPAADILVNHMETINHWNLSKEELNKFIKEKEMDNVKIPADGEKHSF